MSRADYDPRPHVHDEESSLFYCPAGQHTVAPHEVTDSEYGVTCYDCRDALRVLIAIDERRAESAMWAAFARRYPLIPFQTQEA